MMPSFEEEAFERARQMSHNRRAAKPAPPAEPAPPVEPQKPQPQPVEPQKPMAKPMPKPPDLMETLFRNKENSLIMMLLLLLMDENSDPTLIFALVYLLL